MRIIILSLIGGYPDFLVTFSAFATAAWWWTLPLISSFQDDTFLNLYKLLNKILNNSIPNADIILEEMEMRTEQEKLLKQSYSYLERGRGVSPSIGAAYAATTYINSGIEWNDKRNAKERVGGSLSFSVLNKND